MLFRHGSALNLRGLNCRFCVKPSRATLRLYFNVSHTADPRFSRLLTKVAKLGDLRGYMRTKIQDCLQHFDHYKCIYALEEHLSFFIRRGASVVFICANMFEADQVRRF